MIVLIIVAFGMGMAASNKGKTDENHSILHYILQFAEFYVAPLFLFNPKAILNVTPLPVSKHIKCSIEATNIFEVN